MSDQSTEQSPFAKKGFIFAAIGVGVIALALIIAVVPMLLGGGGKTPPPTAAPTASAPTVAGADKSVCGLSGFETESSLTSAPEVDWELVGTVAAPTNLEGSGPGVADGTFRSCYAHTAEGALFAAVGYGAVSSDARNAERIYELLAAGPVRDELEANPSTDGPGSDRLQVAGFKINSYSSDEAVVDVAWAVTTQGGSLVSVPTVLKWEDGDWKVVINENGAPFPPSPLQNLGGYIPWSGV